MVPSMFDETNLPHYTDGELDHYIAASPLLVSVSGQYARSLSKNLIAKPVPLERLYDEVSALDLAQKIGIRVPRVRRVVTISEEDEAYAIIMDRVHGHTLQDKWADIGWWQTFQLGWQLRRFVRKLRTITSNTGGALSSGKLLSPFFDDYYGPRQKASPEALTGYLTWWLQSCRPNHLKPRADMSMALQPYKKFVLTHQDLALRNMMVDGSGKLWLVDWGYAGYFPLYMEYAGMQPSIPWNEEQPWKSRIALWRWKFFRWLAVGSYSREYLAIDEVRRRSGRFRSDRTPYSDR